MRRETSLESYTEHVDGLKVSFHQPITITHFSYKPMPDYNILGKQDRSTAECYAGNRENLASKLDRHCELPLYELLKTKPSLTMSWSLYIDPLVARPAKP